MEYVWGLHPFTPEHDDEIEFKAGERILVVEKDDVYQDGWWRGTNHIGRTGLFPQGYTTSVPPASFAPPAPSRIGPTLGALPEDEEPESSPDDRDGAARHAEPRPTTPPSAPLADPVDASPNGPEGTVLHATMTDIQEAIEQLGTRQHTDSASRSFSFASTRDGAATDDDDDGDVDGQDYGAGWNSRDARNVLAANAARQQQALEARAAAHALHQPPIDVEMSDESEDEDHHHHHPFASPDVLASQSNNALHPTAHITDDEPVVETPLTATARNFTNGHARQESEVTIAQPTPRKPVASEPSLLPHHSSYEQLASIPAAAATLAIPEAAQDEKEPSPLDPTPRASVAIAQTVPLPRSVVASPAPVSAAPPPPVPTIAAVVGPTPSPAPVAVAPPPPAPAAVEAVAPPTPVSLPTPTSPISAVSEKPTSPPSEWSVEEVVAWLRSKKFDEQVCSKFIEHEISGDVLLEMDVNMLKEVDITAFGKRMKIANAIAELRRPASFMSWAPQSVTSSIGGPRTDEGPIYSPESAPHTGDIAGTPLSTSFPVPPDSGVHMRNGKNRPASLALAPDDPSGAKALLTGVSTTTSMSGGIPDFNGIPEVNEESSPREDLNAGETDTVSSNTKTRTNGKGFGRSVGGSISSMHSVTNATTATLTNDSKAKHKSKDSFLSTGSAGKSSPTTPVSAEDKEKTKEKDKEKGKGAVAALRGSHSDSSSRHSFFGGSIGKSRKPAPRYSETQETLEAAAAKPSRSLSRLYLSGGSGSGKHRTRLSGSTPPSSGALSVSDTHTISTPNSEGDIPSAPTSATTAAPSHNNIRERELSQNSPLTPGSTSGGVLSPDDPMQFKPNTNVMQQIGTPDREGWMRKKGQQYNTWKLRYFVLKGPHLYYLRSKNETKIKGYINIKGYRIMADENANPGRYGFRIFHESGVTHWFSSDEQIAIREWMKALMKATIGRDYTKPVMSSVNIPTIPLHVAQAMSPAPRPPSPTQRDATQRALRRENPNQLSSRDARVLMGLPQGAGGATAPPHSTDSPLPTPTTAATPTQANIPGRPARDSARPDTKRRNMALENAQDAELISWINQHIPNASHKATDMSNSLATGLVLYRLAESIKTNGDSDRGVRDSGAPEVPDSIFPTTPNDEKLDGLFVLFDFLLDNDVRMGNVTINDVRSGDRDQLVVLVKALKNWEEKRRSMDNILVRQTAALGPFMGTS